MTENNAKLIARLRAAQKYANNGDLLYEAANALEASQAAEIARLREALEWYADQMCEGLCDKDSKACETIGPDNCAGCPARAALAKEPT